MRLLNVDTFELEEFLDHRATSYAILSHTWDEKEVSFADMQRGLPHAAALPYFKKIRGACDLAAKDGFKFVWVDTCCIDKSSSAELSEAINSMFRWYSDAGICYAYLSDVTEVGDGPEADSQFRKSRWFTRGWTLQELLAPDNVVFYSREWVEVGSKREFASRIAEFTGIDLTALNISHITRFDARGPHPREPKVFDITKFSVAERMSWASGRNTTRQEDIAYCLLGLFGVNMALLYGEGERAFIRLEEEIIKSSDDHSIFAWISSGSDSFMTRGLLATSPSQFKHSGGITPSPIETSTSNTSRPYSMTNKGLSIKMDLVRGYDPEEFFALLDCHIENGLYLAIRLQRGIFGSEFSTPIGDQFTRMRCDELYGMQSRNYDMTAELFVRQTTNLSPVRSRRGSKAFRLIYWSHLFHLDRVLQSARRDSPLHSATRDGELVYIYGHDDEILIDIPDWTNNWVATAILTYKSHGPEIRVMLGWTSEFGVSVHICAGYDENSSGDITEVELRPLSSSTTKMEIMDKSDIWDGAETELIPVSIRVDTQNEWGIDALYNEIYKVTVHDDRYLQPRDKFEVS